MTKLLLSLHVLAAVLLIGPATVAASLFPRYAGEALAPAEGQAGPRPALPAVRLLHRVTRVYAVLGVSVPVFGMATAKQMGVLGDAWLVASMALTAVAAVLLGIAVYTQGAVMAVLDEPWSEEAARSAAARLPRLSMVTGLFALSWAVVTVLMIVRPGSTTGA
ncbi:hypothetical protein [Streptomyces sp. NPDC046261]|uniref:hypothetical protein n=1 Tax=Streptomyces sp. NPDC046261 TaxID=3157200 RepID=UPI0033C38C3C